MSGVAGICFKERFDGGGVENLALRMMAAIAHRGPDGTVAKRFGRGFVGHALLDLGVDGLVCAAGGQITALDGRLDNREELIATLRLDGGARDAALAGEAFRRWGADFAEHLAGDFAVAIWDEGSQRLALARDRFGVRPLYYAVDGAAIAFASEAGAVLAAMPSLRSRLNDGVIGDYVAGRVSDDKSETIYAGLSRLPPAHAAIYEAGALTVRRYWRLQPRARAACADAPEQFAELLSRSIGRRLRSAKPVGCTLSGGLDSSSIACLAARQHRGRLATFSIIFDDDGAPDERRYIASVEAALPQAAPRRIDASRVAAFESIDAILNAQGRPPLAPNIAVHRLAPLEAAARSDIRVLLSGHGGDEVVSHGAHYLTELAERSAWLKLWREIDVSAFSEDISRAALFRILFLRFGPAGKLLRLFRKRFPSGKAPSDPQADGRGYLSPDFAKRIGLDARCAPPPLDPERAALPRSQRMHYETLSAGLQCYAFEALDHDAASAGIVFRYPFWDRELVEFCASLDGAEKWSQGWSRALLRRGMRGIVPEEVLARRDKFDFGPRLVQSMRAADGPARIRRALFDNAGLIEPYVNLKRLRDLFRQFSANAARCSTPEACALWRVTMLSAWLERRIAAPLPSPQECETA